MSRYRKYVPPYDKRNKAGEKICVMCGKSLDGKKRRWCGDHACFRAQFIRAGDQSAMRRYLYENEKEICQGCGANCGMLENVVEWLLRHHTVDGRGEEISCSGTCFGTRLLSQLKELGLNIEVTYSNFHTWEADHIIPIAEGGTHHEDNLQTLCIACHRKDTRELAARLGRKRRGDKLGMAEMFPDQH